MSKRETVKKVIHLGTWVKDVLNDDFMMTVAAAARDQTGKKRKLKLSRAGLKLIQSRFLQESKSVSYPLSEIKTVTKLSEAPSCVMFVLEDKVSRFRIMAFRCGSEADAAQITSLFDQIQLDQPAAATASPCSSSSAAVVVVKEDGENWTMKQRNAHNANRHMAEIFNERSLANGEVKPNGAVTHVILDAGKPAQGHHVESTTQPRPHHPQGDKSSSKGDGKHHRKFPSFKRGSRGSKKKTPHKDEVDYRVVKNRGDEYVIETEVSQYPYVSTKPAHAVIDPEIDVVKTTIPVEVKVTHDHQHDHYSGHQGAGDDNHLIYSQPHSGALLTPPQSKPLVYTSHTYHDDHPPVVYRTNSRTYDPRPRPVTSYYADPWAGHRRFVGEYSTHPRVVSHHPSGHVSDHGSVIMMRGGGDTDSVISKMSKRSRALSKSEFSVKTTVERPIEATYGRRTVVARRIEPAYMLVPVHRHTYHDVLL